MIRIATLVVMLGLSFVGLIVATLQAWNARNGPAPPARGVASKTVDRPQSRPALVPVPPLMEFKETLARPIFEEGRRVKIAVAPPPPRPPAPAPPVTPPPPPAPTADRFRLLGVLMYDGRRRALIEEVSKPSRWYDEGAVLQQWTLARIDGSSILLTLGDRSAELRLYRGTDQGQVTTSTR